MPMTRLLQPLTLVAALMWASSGLADPVESGGGQAFMHYGCFECHGTVGQGTIAGPKLAPKPVPFDVFVAQVRTPANQMPAYPPHLLSDADLTAIYGFLNTQPATSLPPELGALTAQKAH